MTGRIESLQEKIDEEYSKLVTARSSLKSSKEDLESCLQLIEDTKEARLLFQEAAKRTQSTLEYHFSHIVSTAIASVFGEDACKLKVNFVSKRNRTECELTFEKNGHKLDPLFGTGGGENDIASFALRPAYWSMEGKSRPILFLDEPFKFLDADLIPYAAQLLKTISEKLNLQIIMVTHITQLKMMADRIFTVTQNNTKSSVITTDQ